MSVGGGVLCRWEMGLGLRLGLGLGLGLGQDQKNWKRSGEKKKKNEENTTKGENVFIRFKVDKTKKKNSQNFFHWLENSKLVGIF